MLRPAMVALFLLSLVVTSHAELVTLRLGGDAFNGGPAFRLLADDVAIGAGTVTEMDGQDFSFEVPSSTRELGIRFENDAAATVVAGQTRKPGEDRNLIIYQVQIGDRVIAGKQMVREPGQGSELRQDALVLGVMQTVHISMADDAIIATRPAKTAVTASPLQAPTLYGGGSNGSPLVFVGDSLTAGAGATTLRHAYPEQLSGLLGDRRFEVIARGGADSDTILADFEGRAIPEDAVTLIWVGRNNYINPLQVVGDIARIVELLPNKRFLVLSILKGAYANEAPGQPGSAAIDSLNAALEQQYSYRFLPVGQSITAADRTDNIHLNDVGYAEIAAEVKANLQAKGW